MKRASEHLRLLAVVLVWALSFEVFSRYGVFLLPRSFARELTLEAYLAIVQVVTLGIGFTLSFVLLHDPRRDLALRRPGLGGASYALALTPAVFVIATGAAFQLAKPTLLAELLHGGMQEVQKNTGEFGRELTASPAWLAFVWGALVSPVAEEAFFRGAFFTLVNDGIALVGTRGESREALARELLEEGVVVRASRAALAWLRDGGAATLAVAVVFGWLHHDMPGGLGIVRFVSALGLGVACGLFRQWSASVAPPMLVHVGFNALSLATARRLVVTDSFPVKSGVPTLVVAIAAVLGWAAALAYLLARSRARA